MKVSLGMKLQSGPWGGGNQFGYALTEYLRQKGVNVYFHLNEPELDIILLCEPRTNLQISAYSEKDIFQYVHQINSRTIIIHRINECDERKGTTDVNKRLLHANLCADYTVFVATWVKELFIQQGIPCKSHGVILNGSDKTIFHSHGYQRWDRTTPLRIITHHWSGHWMKGFDIYERLDRLLTTESFKNMITFTYIGNVPKGFRFRHANYIEPIHGVELANLIRGHHVYLTASRNEPGGHHQNEGANCGLPLLYRESGCLPEYCRGFGISFTEENFEQQLREMMSTYDVWVARMKDYPHTAERMCENYYYLFMALLKHRDKILQCRKWWRKPLWFAKRRKT